MSAAEKAAAEKAAEQARAAEAARAAKAAAAAEADLRRPARQAQVLAEWKASAGIASYYDAGVRLSSKTGEPGLGLGANLLLSTLSSPKPVPKSGKSAATGGGGDDGGGGGAIAGLALVAAAGYYLSTGQVDLGGGASLDTSGMQKQLQAHP